MSSILRSRKRKAEVLGTFRNVFRDVVASTLEPILIPELTDIVLDYYEWKEIDLSQGIFLEQVTTDGWARMVFASTLSTERSPCVENTWILHIVNVDSNGKLSIDALRGIGPMSDKKRYQQQFDQFKITQLFTDLVHFTCEDTKLNPFEYALKPCMLRNWPMILPDEPHMTLLSKGDILQPKYVTLRDWYDPSSTSLTGSWAFGPKIWTGAIHPITMLPVGTGTLTTDRMIFQGVLDCKGIKDGKGDMHTFSLNRNWHRWFLGEWAHHDSKGSNFTTVDIQHGYFGKARFEDDELSPASVDAVKPFAKVYIVIEHHLPRATCFLENTCEYYHGGWCQCPNCLFKPNEKFRDILERREIEEEMYSRLEKQ